MGSKYVWEMQEVGFWGYNTRTSGYAPDWPGTWSCFLAPSRFFNEWTELICTNTDSLVTPGTAEFDIVAIRSWVTLPVWATDYMGP